MHLLLFLFNWSAIHDHEMQKYPSSLTRKLIHRKRKQKKHVFNKTEKLLRLSSITIASHLHKLFCTFHRWTCFSRSCIFDYYRRSLNCVRIPIAHTHTHASRTLFSCKDARYFTGSAEEREKRIWIMRRCAMRQEMVWIFYDARASTSVPSLWWPWPTVIFMRHRSAKWFSAPTECSFSVPFRI